MSSASGRRPRGVLSIKHEKQILNALLNQAAKRLNGGELPELQPVPGDGLQHWAHKQASPCRKPGPHFGQYFHVAHPPDGRKKIHYYPNPPLHLLHQDPTIQDLKMDFERVDDPSRKYSLEGFSPTLLSAIESGTFKLTDANQHPTRRYAPYRKPRAQARSSHMPASSPGPASNGSNTDHYDRYVRSSPAPAPHSFESASQRVRVNGLPLQDRDESLPPVKAMFGPVRPRQVARNVAEVHVLVVSFQFVPS
jgi:hypothetical protein